MGVICSTHVRWEMWCCCPG